MQGEVWRHRAPCLLRALSPSLLWTFPQLIGHDHRGRKATFLIHPVPQAASTVGLGHWRQFGCDGMSVMCTTLLISHIRVHLPPHTCAPASTHLCTCIQTCVHLLAHTCASASTHVHLLAHTCASRPHTCASVSTQSKWGEHRPCSSHREGKGRLRTRSRDFLMSFEPKAPNFLSR